jgi:hypothetical protein
MRIITIKIPQRQQQLQQVEGVLKALLILINYLNTKRLFIIILLFYYFIILLFYYFIILLVY